MKDFFKSFFASFLALAVFGGLAFVLFIGFLAALGSSGKPTVPDKAVLVLDLSTNIPDSVAEGDPSSALRQALNPGPKEIALQDLIEALDRAAADPHISGLFLTGSLQPQGYGSGPAALLELRQALARFKAKKPIVAYNQAWSRRDYYLAAGATKLYVNPFGELQVNGLASEPMFYGDAFKQYGVQVEVTRVGKYKSAVEPYILDKMSAENREQIQKLLDDIWGEWKRSVAADRHTSPEALQAIADNQGLLASDEALKAGLVDKLAAYDEVLDELKRMSGASAKAKDFPQIDMATYADMPVAGSSAANRIAVVYAEGEIVDGDGREGQIGGDSLSRELRRVRLDERVKAVVLRVNSPGGSATASDLIQREVILTKQVKPVVISMGTVAASGGYWISTYGDRIFAEPSTITGSIGVFGLLPNVQKLANEHGITWDEVSTAKMANPMTLARPKTEQERGRIQGLVDRIYDQFLTKVSESRHKPKEQVHEIAQGRVWSGEEGLKLGLVDELGGLDQAVAYAAKKAGVANNYRILEGEPAKPPFQKLMESLGGAKPRRLVKAGPAEQLEQQFKQQLQLLESLNDPNGVYVRMPLDLVVK